MKKFWFVLFAALAALLSCGKDAPLSKPGGDNIIFQLEADITKAVKTGWEDGDVIFVFFHQNEGCPEVVAPAYLEMKYQTSGSSGTWSYTVPNGPLGIEEGNSGTMRALYLPFGNTSVIEKDGANFKFKKPTASYYLTDSMSYTVENNKVSGSFRMRVPDGYVQFYVADNTDKKDSTYKLATDAVAPVDVLSVSADGTINLKQRTAGANMYGYVYRDGYLFSGKLVSGYAYGNNYYFAKTKADDSRADYYVGGKTLVSHQSVTLPANGSAKWEPVGPSNTVLLSKGTGNGAVFYGEWYTCNEGAVNPENSTGSGSRLEYRLALDRVTANKVLPSTSLLTGMISGLTWIPMSVHGYPGLLVLGENAFLFFPVVKSTLKDYYWSADTVDEDHAYQLYLESGGTKSLQSSLKTSPYPARYLKVSP